MSDVPSNPPSTEPAPRHHLVREIYHHQTVDPGDTLNARLTVWSDRRDPNGGNAAHHYQIVHPDRGEPAAVVHFQHGPRNVPESEPGTTDQALLSILIDRYDGYQGGPFACPENEEVLTHLTAALTCMGQRSRARREQGVIGQNLTHKSAEVVVPDVGGLPRLTPYEGDDGDLITASGEITLLAEAEALEKRIGQAAHDAGRGPVGLALNVAKTQVGGAIGWLLRAEREGGAVGSG